MSSRGGEGKEGRLAATTYAAAADRAKNLIARSDWLFFVAFTLRHWQLLLEDGYDLATMRLLATVRPYTMVPNEGLKNVIDLCESVERSRIPGAFVECGTWNGGCAALMGAVSKRHSSRRRLYLFDSFRGIPEPTFVDGSRAHQFVGGKSSGRLETTGQLVGSKEAAQGILRKLEIDDDLVSIVQGWFQETIPLKKQEIGPIAVLRLDGDWYESTKVCLENLYDLVSPRGVVVIDDYGYWEGCKRATDEFFRQRGLNAEIKDVNGSICYFTKPCG